MQIDDKYYGVCNNGHHIEEIKTRVGNKMEITRQSNLNYKSVDYAIAEVKSLYQQLAKKNKTYELHKWEGEERKKFFRTLILCYLDCEKAKASNGVDSG